MTHDDPFKKKSFLDIFHEVHQEGDEEDVSYKDDAHLADEEFGFVDNLDAEILMHRDVHFAGQFSMMLDYYRDGGRGCHPDFQLERIEYLAACEEGMGQNLASMILTGAQAERVHRALEAYKHLQDIYEDDEVQSPYPILIADLILTEEMEPEAEIDAIVAAGEDIVSSLKELLQSDLFLDPLFPGYGQGPALAAVCLGRIQSPKAIVPLFEALAHSDFSTESEVLSALRQIGDPARDFLLKLMAQKPITLDNERAAMALGCFGLDPEIAARSLKLLQDPVLMAKSQLAAYILLGCEGLAPELHASFVEQISKPEFPASLQSDAQLILRSWRNK